MFIIHIHTHTVVYYRTAIITNNNKNNAFDRLLTLSANNTGWRTNIFVEGTKLIFENLFSFQGHVKHKCAHIIIILYYITLRYKKYYKRKARGISSISKLVSMARKHTNKMLPKHIIIAQTILDITMLNVLYMYLYTSTDQPSI